MEGVAVLTRHVAIKLISFTANFMLHNFVDTKKLCNADDLTFKQAVNAVPPLTAISRFLQIILGPPFVTL
jgi:hypothetical protein